MDDGSHGRAGCEAQHVCQQPMAVQVLVHTAGATTETSVTAWLDLAGLRGGRSCRWEHAHGAECEEFYSLRQPESPLGLDGSRPVVQEGCTVL